LEKVEEKDRERGIGNRPQNSQALWFPSIFLPLRGRGLKLPNFLDKQVYDELQARKDSKGIIEVPSPNHKILHFLQITHSESSDPGQVCRLNEQVNTLLEYQGGREKRLEECLCSKSVRGVATDLLSITCNLGPKATVDFLVAGGFDKEQAAIIRSTGIKMANAQEIKAEKQQRKLPMSHSYQLLEAKPREGEPFSKVEVRIDLPFLSFPFVKKHPSLLFSSLCSSLLELSFLYLIFFLKKGKDLLSKESFNDNHGICNSKVSRIT